MKPKEITDFEERFQGIEQDIIVVTGVDGVSFGMGGAEKFWTARIGVTAWQPLRGDHVIENDIRLTVKILDNDFMQNLKDKLKGDSLVAVRVKAGREENEFLIKEILDVKINSEKLEVILANQKKEVTYEDDFFGVFILNRRLNLFEKEMDWLNKKIRFDFEKDTTENMKLQLEAAKDIFEEPQDWDDYIKVMVAGELLDSKNDNWLNDGEEKLTLGEFVSRIALTAIQITRDCKFRCWFDDGNIFYGHSIYAEGDSQYGPTDINLFG